MLTEIKKLCKIRENQRRKKSWVTIAKDQDIQRGCYYFSINAYFEVQYNIRVLQVENHHSKIIFIICIHILKKNTFQNIMTSRIKTQKQLNYIARSNISFKSSIMMRFPEINVLYIFFYKNDLLLPTKLIKSAELGYSYNIHFLKIIITKMKS